MTLTRRIRITTRDSAGVVMEEWVETLTLDPTNDNDSDEGIYPADERGGRHVVQQIAESIFGNVREGLACSVQVEAVDAPATVPVIIPRGSMQAAPESEA